MSENQLSYREIEQSQNFGCSFTSGHSSLLRQRCEPPFCFSISHETMQEKQSRNQGKKRKRTTAPGSPTSEPAKRDRAEEEEERVVAERVAEEEEKVTEGMDSGNGAVEATEEGAEKGGNVKSES